MRPERFFSVVTENMVLKIVSLAIAICIWVYVTAQIGEAQRFRIPLELVDVPESLAVVHEIPKDVEVTMRGNRSELIKSRLFGRVRATVELAAAHRGRMVLPITASMLSLPEGFKSEDVTVEGPKSLVLVFEPVFDRSVPVEPAFGGSLPHDMILVGKPTVAPDRVLLRGAASALDTISSVRTETIDLGARRGRFSREVSIVTGGAVREAIPRKVVVDFEVASRATRTIEGIAPTILPAEENVSVDYSPKTAAITVEGPEELVKRLVPEDVSIVLTIGKGRRGVLRVRPEVIVPPGIDGYSLSVESFEVTVAAKR